MQIATGSYLGDGTSSRGITGIGFQPDLVIVKSGANNLVFRTATMVTDGAAALPVVGATNVASILSLDSGGFTVNSAANVNSSGATYYWIAVRDNGAGDFTQGKYSGNNVNGRGIAGLGFAPNLAVVKRDASVNQGAFRTSVHSGNDCCMFAAVVNSANVIVSNDADGFTVGTTGTVNLNVTGGTYYYFAFKTTASQFAVGTYAGDDSDDRLITALPHVDAAFIKGNAAQLTTLRTAGYPPDLCSRANASVDIGNALQNFRSGGFELGTSLSTNASGTTYYWFAWQWRSNVPMIVDAYARQRSS